MFDKFDRDARLVTSAEKVGEKERDK